MSLPPSRNPSNSTSSNSGKMVAGRKRPLSLVDKLVKARRMEDSSSVDCELTQDQDNQYVEFTLHTLRMQRLSEYKQPVYIAPMAKPNLQAEDDTLFPIVEKVKDFLAGDCQVMLILGDSGAGKSTFSRYLEYELWKDYKTDDRIPLFVNLLALERPERDLIAEQLRIYKFSETQIRELEEHRQFVLICDGYDEGQLTSNLHTTNLLNQCGQRDAKLLITCRTQYLGPDYRLRFVPKAVNQYSRAANDLFLEAVIAPFSKLQIEDYVERYVPLEPRTWVKDDYTSKLEKIPSLVDLVKNPFLLTLCLEALPNVVQGQSDLSRLRVARIQLYDSFVQHWLEVNKRRLRDSRLDRDKLLAFEELLEDGFESNGIKYQRELAAAIFREQDGRPIVDYIHKRDKSSWKRAFFSPDLETTILRDASLLNRVETQYRFVHQSILDYFYSCWIYDSTYNNEEFDPHPRFNSSNISDHPLSQRNLVLEPSIIQFLAERVQLDPNFKQQLLAFVEQSKTDNHAACAAANAITILVKAGISFNDADLRGIRVPGADLSDGQFNSAQLQEANLTMVNLARSWIRQADFSGARMEGVQFGELPFLEEDCTVSSIAYSQDEESFVVSLEKGDINVYSTTDNTGIDLSPPTPSGTDALSEPGLPRNRRHFGPSSSLGLGDVQPGSLTSRSFRQDIELSFTNDDSLTADTSATLLQTLGTGDHQMRDNTASSFEVIGNNDESLSVVVPDLRDDDVLVVNDADQPAITPARPARRFPCPYPDCTKPPFSTKWNLELHLNTHLGVTFTCPYNGCGNVYARYGDRLRHMQRAHQGYFWRCVHCQKVLTRKPARKRLLGCNVNEGSLHVFQISISVVVNDP